MKDFKIKFSNYDKYELNFEKLRQIYDVVHVAGEVVWGDLRYYCPGHDDYSDFYLYDVESYMIFNTDAIDKKSIRIYHNPHWLDIKKEIEKYKEEEIC